MTYYKTICNLNYRTGPGIQYTRVGTMLEGTMIKVVSVKDKWAKFEKNRKYYYCSLKYLREVKDYGAIVAKDILPLAKLVVKNKAAHIGGRYSYKGDRINCSVFVSTILQNAGVLGDGVVVYHTSKTHRKKTIGDVVHNRLKVKHYTWHKTNALYKNLNSKYKKPGCIYVYASSIGIRGSDGYIYGCHSSGCKYTNLSMIKHKGKAYEYTDPILVVGVPSIE